MLYKSARNLTAFQNRVLDIKNARHYDKRDKTVHLLYFRLELYLASKIVGKNYWNQLVLDNYIFGRMINVPDNQLRFDVRHFLIGMFCNWIWSESKFIQPCDWKVVDLIKKFEINGFDEVMVTVILRHAFLQLSLVDCYWCVYFGVQT